MAKVMKRVVVEYKEWISTSRPGRKLEVSPSPAILLLANYGILVGHVRATYQPECHCCLQLFAIQ